MPSVNINFKVRLEETTSHLNNKCNGVLNARHLMRLYWNGFAGAHRVYYGRSLFVYEAVAQRHSLHRKLLMRNVGFANDKFNSFNKAAK